MATPTPASVNWFLRLAAAFGGLAVLVGAMGYATTGAPWWLIGAASSGIALFGAVVGSRRGARYEFFVALRYLRAPTLRFSKVAAYVLAGCVVVAVSAAVLAWRTGSWDSVLELGAVPLTARYALVAVGVVSGVTLLFALLRLAFSFFTTVSIGGVWIGTLALVLVLSIMAGFERDLREKILGSNAHILISKPEGAFEGWREVMVTARAVPGVVAASPYATTEVVLSSFSGATGLVLKGIDPETAGQVTKLVENIEGASATERSALRWLGKYTTVLRLWPLQSEPRRLPPKLAGGAPSTLDAAPADWQRATHVPVDFSRPTGDAPAVPVDDFQSGAKRTKLLHGILVGRGMASQFELHTGSEVKLVSPLADPANPDASGTPIPYNRDFRVAGRFYSGHYEYDMKYGYVLLSVLQDFLDRGDTVDGIEILTRDAETAPQVAKALGKVLGPSYRVQAWTELNKSLFASLQLEKTVMFFVLGIVVLVASFSIVGNLIMVVVEKGREIALLKTLGTTNRTIMNIFLMQGLIIGLIGTLLGVGLGLLLCYTVEIPIKAEVYYISIVPIFVEGLSVATVAVTAVVVSILATLYPAWLSTTVRPAYGLKQ